MSMAISMRTSTRRVPPIDHFVQQEPNEGAAATEKTLAWLFYDDNNFYVAVRNYDSQPDRLVANELRRDNFNIFQNDHTTISIDSLYTRRSGVFFKMNALGAQRDQEVSGPTQQQQRLEHHLGRQGEDPARRLVDGVRHSLFIAALPERPAASVGL